MAVDGQAAPLTGETIGHKNSKIGHVVSTKMAKTIVVEVIRRVPHPLYKRIVTKRKRFYAHDEVGEAQLGDVVRIVECRPLSALKRWRLGEVVRKAVTVTAEPAVTGDAGGKLSARPAGKPAEKSGKTGAKK
jgi:small subunit ribosomal protein S17